MLLLFLLLLLMLLLYDLRLLFWLLCRWWCYCCCYCCCCWRCCGCWCCSSVDNSSVVFDTDAAIVVGGAAVADVVPLLMILLLFLLLLLLLLLLLDVLRLLLMLFYLWDRIFLHAYQVRYYKTLKHINRTQWIYSFCLAVIDEFDVCRLLCLQTYLRKETCFDALSHFVKAFDQLIERQRG